MCVCYLEMKKGAECAMISWGTTNAGGADSAASDCGTGPRFERESGIDCGSLIGCSSAATFPHHPSRMTACPADSAPEWNTLARHYREKG